MRQDSHFTAARGTQLYYQLWLPAKVRGGVILVHGIGEHSGRYEGLVQPLCQAGFAVASFDHPGHGRSPGQRGHIERWQDYQTNLKLFFQLVSTQLPQQPLFLYGHSLGALIALDYSLQSPQLAGLIISGTPVRPAGRFGNPVLIAIARLLSQVWPTLTFKTQLDPSLLSRDPALRQQYLHDPLVHSAVTARWGTESLKAIARIKQQAAKVCCPVLMLHGEADQISLLAPSLQFFEDLGSADKTLKVYPGGYHEPHNDCDRAQVASDVITWLEQHLP
ncbi:alpha/beta hydrolase [Almyronema epifaneia]|uniref:Alpha/beta hydrolase n=1 Tax=Almyronema epifaneia S1 TaxID=2991925 RepID=A0ABW6I9S6_9CYAN